MRSKMRGGSYNLRFSPARVGSSVPTEALIRVIYRAHTDWTATSRPPLSIITINGWLAAFVQRRWEKAP